MIQVNNPYYSMMFSTCRERWLGKVDPNVPDENFSWIVGPRLSGIGVWRNVDGIEGQNLISPSGKGFTVDYTENVPHPFSAYVQGRDSPLYGPSFLTGPHRTGGHTSELYFRAIIVFTKANGAGAIASIKNADGTVPFRVYGESNSSNGYTLTVDYKDSNTVSRTLRVTRNSRAGNYWIDMKVFLPAPGNTSHSAELYVEDIAYQGTPTTPLRDTKPAFTGGFLDKTGQVFSVFSMDGQNARNWDLGIYRVGVGNRLTTARP